jgi:hypothetical protein
VLLARQASAWRIDSAALHCRLDREPASRSDTRDTHRDVDALLNYVAFPDEVHPVANPQRVGSSIRLVRVVKRGGILHVVLWRSRPDRPQLGATVIVSASEHLIVEQPLAPPRRRRRRRWVLASCILLVCAGAIIHLLASPPGPALGRIAAHTPTAWFHRYAYRRQLRLVSVIDYGTSAVLRIAVAPRHIRVLWLQEHDGLWRAVASGGH